MPGGQSFRGEAETRFDPPPVAPVLQYEASSSLLRQLRTFVVRHSAPCGPISTPQLYEIELARGMGIGVDAHKAAEDRFSSRLRLRSAAMKAGSIA